MAVIIDLDLTLVDSSIAADLRRQRQWNAVYQAIPRFSIYDGVVELLHELSGRHVPVCIVTSSPSSYCDRVLNHFGIPCDACVCYHDTRLHKPHPEPLLLALQRLRVKAKDALSVGDEPHDIVAARAAGIASAAAIWGASDRAAVLAESPDVVCETPAELRDHLKLLFP